MVYDNFQVAKAIKELRLANNMSLDELSNAVDRSSDHLYQIELGSRKIGMELLYSMMTVFNTDANTVLGLSSKEKDTVEKSIDSRLNQLELGKKVYFMNIFHHMLDTLSELERID